ncbi:MAG: hypothetical protein NVS4B3_26870 [Gemmatimonadaceae bacterium]
MQPIHRALSIAVLLGAGLASARPGSAQQPAPATGRVDTGSHASRGALTPPPLSGLAAQAKISMDAAREIALKRVAGGTIKSGELERDHGRLVYSFDVAVSGKTGVDEVTVDATTGALISVKHETPADEAREARADMRARQRRAREMAAARGDTGKAKP